MRWATAARVEDEACGGVDEAVVRGFLTVGWDLTVTAL